MIEAEDEVIVDRNRDEGASIREDAKVNMA
jgi:hypothetical protein